MTTVAILGAGDIGGAVAYALARGDVARVLLVDERGQVASGKALDLQQAGAIVGSRTRLEGTADATRAIGCTVCVVADRFGAGEWTADDGLSMLSRLARDVGSAPFVFAGTSHATFIEVCARELGLARRRLIGSAPEAFASAARAMVAVEAGCSPQEVALSVFGVPPRDLIIPWTDVSIGGVRADVCLSQAQLAHLEARVGRVWPPGPYTLGLAAAEMARAVSNAPRSSFSVLTALDGEFERRRGIGIVRARLGGAGIVDTLAPTLSSRDSVRVQTALSAAARH